MGSEAGSGQLVRRRESGEGKKAEEVPPMPIPGAVHQATRAV